MIVSGRFGANFKQNGGVHWIYNYYVTVFSFHEYSGMDERIIRLCEENNGASLVQTLSSLKSQKVRMLQRYMSVLWNTDFSNPKVLTQKWKLVRKWGVRKIGGGIESLMFYRSVVLLEPRRPQTATIFIIALICMSKQNKTSENH